MEVLSRAEIYFKELVERSDLYEHLCSFAGSTEPVYETEWLDFKVGSGPSLEDKVKRQKWSEALSGFGNTEGGVLIWGLEAKKNQKTGIDGVTGLALCPDVVMLEQLLRQSLHEACDPPISGVQIRTVPGANGREGFVVCLIPEGSLKPHRAELAGKTFYLRIGDSFKIPSVSILRSMFYSREKPYMVPMVTPLTQDAGCRFLIEIRNQGAATASEIFVKLEWSAGVEFSTMTSRDMENTLFYSSSMAIPIRANAHPGMSAACAELAHPDRKVFSRMDLEGRPLRFRCKIYCRDTQPLEWQITLDHHAVVGQKRLTFDVAENAG